MRRRYINQTNLAAITVSKERVVMDPGFGCGHLAVEISRKSAAQALRQARAAGHTITRQKVP